MFYIPLYTDKGFISLFNFIPFQDRSDLKYYLNRTVIFANVIFVVLRNFICNPHDDGHLVAETYLGI
jgi:hypothetical protein